MDNDRQVILFQVVRELLVNVGKHSRASQAKVILSLEKPLLKIQVNDDGVGFDASRIFGPRETHGGFGFFSMRERLNYLGGRLEVKSKPGQGSQIILTVPQEAGRGRKGRTMSVKIIIADDHKIMRDGLRLLLEKEKGLEVIAEAKNGRETIGLAEQLRPDIIIMDISMDDLNGMDATRQIVGQGMGLPDHRPVHARRQAFRGRHVRSRGRGLPAQGLRLSTS